MEIITELKQYLTLKKWRYRSAGDGKNIAIKTCPFCGKSKWKFYIHMQKTIYRCWHCDARGNLYKLKRELGDLQQLVSAAQAVGGVGKKGKPIPLEHIERWHAKLLGHEKALDYCARRGLETETLRHFKIGLQRKNGINWLVIPHINEGVCHNVKFRSLPPAEKTFRRVKGSASVLFNEDCLADHQDIVIVEGELDAMSMWAAGVENVIGLTGGAETFLPEWYDLLTDKDSITIVMDADPVGQDGARSIARRLGFDKCKNVLLPMKDANDVLVNLGKQELVRTLDAAEQFEVHGILPMNDVLLQCTTTVELGGEGLHTPWHDVNRLIGPGWQPGDLVVLSAKIKVGKTTWALCVLKHLAEQGIPGLMYCLEMRPKRLAQKLVANHRQKGSDDLQLIDYQLARYYLHKLPIYFVEPEWGGGLKVEAVLDKIRETVKRYGIRVMVFDHLHFLCRSLQYLTNEVGQVCRSFKLLAEELEIVVILIAQPKKIQGERVIKYDDIKDSSAIPADADQIILLHRAAIPAGQQVDADESSEMEVLEPKTLVRIDAARFRGGGECYLHYDGATATYHDWSNRPATKW